MAEQIGLEAVFKTEAFRRGFSQYQSALGDASRATDQASSGMAGAIGSFAKAGTLAFIGLGAAAAGALVGIGAIGVTNAISLESAFAGVIKTTDGLVDSSGELTEVGADLRQGFRDLAKEVPIAVEELLGIGELAGQLGVPKEALLEFTETVAALGVSTNLTTEEAATSLARLGNIYQISSEDMAENTARVGAAIVDLGNNFATTEADILAFGENIAGAGAIAGLTQADVLGIGTALSSVGVEAAAGGTAVQKVLLEMVTAVSEGGSQLENFAKVAGVSTAEFAQAFEDDAAGAFTSFVEGLGVAGDDAIGFLDELGLSDARLTRAFLSLAGAGDLLGDAISTSNDAFEEGTALNEEAAKRYATTESQIEIFKNTMRDVAFSIGDLLLPALNDMLQVARPLIDAFGELAKDIFERVLAPALENVVSLIGRFTSGDMTLANLIPPELMFAILGIQKGFDDLLLFWEENGPFFQQIAEEVFGAIAETFQHIADEVVPFLVEQFQKISQWFVDHGPEIQAAVENIATFFEETLLPAIERAVPIIEAILGGLIDAVLNLADVVINILGGDWEGAWEGAKEFVRNLLEDTIPNILLAFADFVAGFLGTDWQSIVEQWKTNWDLFVTIVAAIVDIIKDKVSDFVQAGSDLIEGLAQGIKDKANEVLKTLKDILEDIVKVAQDIFNFGSPSKVFIDFGEDIMRGFQQGLASLSGLPVAEVRQVSEGVVSAGASAPASMNQTVRPVIDPQLLLAPMMAQEAVSEGNRFEVNMNNQFYDRIDEAVFFARAERVFREILRDAR